LVPSIGRKRAASLDVSLEDDELLVGQCRLDFRYAR
jgi:hypothetical protein